MQPTDQVVVVAAGSEPGLDYDVTIPFPQPQRHLWPLGAMMLLHELTLQRSGHGSSSISSRGAPDHGLAAGMDTHKRNQYVFK